MPRSQYIHLPVGTLTTVIVSASSFPLTLPNLAIWLDPSDTSTITATSGAVSQISDKSGNANHFSQATSAWQPTTAVDTINGLNVLKYSGAQKLVCVNAITCGPSFTVAAVVKAVSIDGVNSSGILSIDDDGGPVGILNRIAQFRWTSATVPQSIGFHGASGSAVAYFATGAGATSIITTAQVHVGVWDDSTPAITNYLNGSANGTTTPGASLNARSFAPQVGVADAGSNAGNIGFGLWNGDIAELVVCQSALSTSNRNALEAYLKTKWNTP